MNSYKELRRKITAIGNLELFNACEQIWLDPRYKAFKTKSAAVHYHHTGLNGLSDHTLEVMIYAENMALSFPQVDSDILIAACLWHDVAKIWEYEDDPMVPMTWFRGPYASLIGHISGSNAEFVSIALKFGVDEVLIRKISHAILAHHGPVKDWGSSVAPQALEALLLHQADMLSANYGATK